MRNQRVTVIGAGVGGLVGALDLACRGFDVTVIERAAGPGGKMRQVEVDDRSIDSGPTVFTMRWIFDEIFAAAGVSLDSYVTLRPAKTLARHHWGEKESLDLFADIGHSADAIGAFAGAAEAKRYRQFCDRAARVYAALEKPFLYAGRPTPISLAFGAGAGGLAGLLSGAPFSTLWRELGGHFHDPRLRQLFGRYSTYCGSSPYLAPAMLMLIAHVEQRGVWLVDGGMHQVALALARLGREKGVTFRYECEVADIAIRDGRVTGVTLDTGERIESDTVVVNADAAALAKGFFGREAAVAGSPVSPVERSLSAVTWSMVANTGGFPLVRHNVFFSNEYAKEFEDIFQKANLPSAPTVYICAQDRGDTDETLAIQPERLFCLVNAPATGDRRSFDDSEIEQCEKRTFAALDRCGLHIDRRRESSLMTTPRDFERMFPGTGGALYGRATHGWQASFRRPGARTRIAGLYLAGGGAHPGAGVPMAALSGRLAANSIWADLPSMTMSAPTATGGGISTRLAKTGRMA